MVMYVHQRDFLFFFFNDTATTEIYTLSLHDALPICSNRLRGTSTKERSMATRDSATTKFETVRYERKRSEEHTSELQSRLHLVCRLLLEKKKKEPTPAESGDVSDQN